MIFSDHVVLWVLINPITPHRNLDSTKPMQRSINVNGEIITWESQIITWQSQMHRKYPITKCGLQRWESSL